MSENNRIAGQLTEHPVGSLREIWKMAFPLILMSLSVFGMIFGDRMIVSHYSIEAMNSIGLVSVVYEIFHVSFLMVAIIAEVFVGQYFGSQQDHKIGKPVWQMIYFSLIAGVITIPLAIFGAEWFIPENLLTHGTPYFYWMMLFLMFGPMGAALAAFFIGRGKTHIVTYVIAGCNIFNLLLDILLVFGWEGVIPSMGTKGAAIATGISLLMQCSILMFVFLRKKNRERFNTHDYRFDKKEFMRCVNIGLPNAISMTIAITAWYLFFRMMEGVDQIYFTALIVGQNYFYIQMSFSDGIGKAATAIASNLIGADRSSEIRRVTLAAIKLISIFAVLLFIPYVLFPDLAINLFITGDNANLEQMQVTRAAMFWTWINFIVFAMFQLYMSLLTAAGDTRYIMYVNAITAWVCLIIPAYILIKVLKFSPDLSWKIMVFDIAIALLIMARRYNSGKWKKLQIIEKTT